MNQLNFWALPWKWALSSVYFLSKKGADFLCQKLGYEQQQIKRPLWRSSFFVTDYAHRLATIDFKIRFYKRLAKKGYKLNFFDCYFERDGGNNSHGGTTLRSRAALQVGDIQIIPDAVVGYTTPQGVELFVFEQHMGKDVKRALRQIQNHCWALSQWAVNMKYGSSVGCRVVYVFEDEGCGKKVSEAFNNSEQFSNFRGLFTFAV